VQAASRQLRAAVHRLVHRQLKAKLVLLHLKHERTVQQNERRLSDWLNETIARIEFSFGPWFPQIADEAMKINGKC
jgi:hypothetical protein